MGRGIFALVILAFIFASDAYAQSTTSVVSKSSTFTASGLGNISVLSEIIKVDTDTVKFRYTITNQSYNQQGIIPVTGPLLPLTCNITKVVDSGVPSGLVTGQSFTSSHPCSQNAEPNTVTMFAGGDGSVSCYIGITDRFILSGVGYRPSYPPVPDTIGFYVNDCGLQNGYVIHNGVLSGGELAYTIKSSSGIPLETFDAGLANNSGVNFSSGFVSVNPVGGPMTYQEAPVLGATRFDLIIPTSWDSFGGIKSATVDGVPVGGGGYDGWQLWGGDGFEVASFIQNFGGRGFALGTTKVAELTVAAGVDYIVANSTMSSRGLGSLYAFGWVINGDVLVPMPNGAGTRIPNDTTPPVVTITSPTANQLFGPTAQIAIAYSLQDPESGIQSEGATIDGVPMPNSTFNYSKPYFTALITRSFTISAGTLNPNITTYTLTVTATNGVNLPSTQSVNFIVDTTPPVITITSPTPNQVFGPNDQITISYTVQDAKSGIQSGSASVDTTQVDSFLFTSPYSTQPLSRSVQISASNLSHGNHTVTVTEWAQVVSATLNSGYRVPEERSCAWKDTAG